MSDEQKMPTAYEATPNQTLDERSAPCTCGLAELLDDLLPEGEE